MLEVNGNNLVITIKLPSPYFTEGKRTVHIYYIYIYQTGKLWKTQVAVFGMQTQKKPSVDHCMMNMQSSSSFSSRTTLV